MLTKEELEQFRLIASKDELLLKVLEEVNSIHTDPTKVFYRELIQTVMAMSKEMEFVRTGKKELAHIIASEDKIFERMTKLITDSEKIFAGLRKGKEDVFPDEAKSDKEKEKESGISFADKIANKKRREQ